MKQSYDLGKLRTDPRFIALAELLGNEQVALWNLTLFWDCALNYWKKRELVPKKVFDLNRSWARLVEVGLAEIRDDAVYAKGAKDAFDWVLDLQASKHEAGVASAKARREKFGTAQPQPANKLKTEQRSDVFDRTEARTASEQSEQPRTDPNASISISVSTSVSEEEREHLKSSLPVYDLPSPKDLAQLWNDLKAPNQRAVNLKSFKPASRRWVWAKARLVEHPDLAYWKEVIERIAASTFCRGDSERAWQADFDFLVRSDTHMKVLEGKYDDRDAADDGKASWAEFDRIVGVTSGEKRTN